MSSCLFGLFKVIYIILTSMVLGFHVFYIYHYVENLREIKSFFNHNQFAHFMGMFLGFLFRVSGLLSACKEKIALTCTYSLFLVLILLLSRQVDWIFAIHAITAAYALLFVLVLKYRRHKQRRRLLRHQVPSSSLQSSGASRNNYRNNYASTRTMVTVDLAHGPGSHATNVQPTAPPFESQLPLSVPRTIFTNNSNSGHINSNLVSSGNPLLNHTPPPSYTELFESK